MFSIPAEMLSAFPSYSGAYFGRGFNELACKSRDHVSRGRATIRKKDPKIDEVNQIFPLNSFCREKKEWQYLIFSSLVGVPPFFWDLKKSPS